MRLVLVSVKLVFLSIDCLSPFLIAYLKFHFCPIQRKPKQAKKQTKKQRNKLKKKKKLKKI